MNTATNPAPPVTPRDFYFAKPALGLADVVFAAVVSHAIDAIHACGDFAGAALTPATAYIAPARFLATAEFMAAALAMFARAAQAPTEASARAMRAAAHREGLPVVGSRQFVTATERTRAAAKRDAAAAGLDGPTVAQRRAALHVVETAPAATEQPEQPRALSTAGAKSWRAEKASIRAAVSQTKVKAGFYDLCVHGFTVSVWTFGRGLWSIDAPGDAAAAAWLRVNRISEAPTLGAARALLARAAKPELAAACVGGDL